MKMDEIMEVIRELSYSQGRKVWAAVQKPLGAEGKRSR